MAFPREKQWEPAWPASQKARARLPAVPAARPMARDAVSGWAEAALAAGARLPAEFQVAGVRPPAGFLAGAARFRAAAVVRLPAEPAVSASAQRLAEVEAWDAAGAPQREALPGERVSLAAGLSAWPAVLPASAVAARPSFPFLVFPFRFPPAPRSAVRFAHERQNLRTASRS